MGSQPQWKQAAAATVAKAETAQQIRQLLRLHLVRPLHQRHHMNSRDHEEGAVWGARAVLTRIRTPIQLESAVKDILGDLQTATAHGATLRLELAAFCMECFGFSPLAGCLPWVMKQLAQECGIHKLETTRVALMELAGAITRAVVGHLRIDEYGEGAAGRAEDGDGTPGAPDRGTWLTRLLAEPLIRALSSGPHAQRMAHAAAALGTVVSEAQAAMEVPAVVAMAQRCLEALLCMGANTTSLSDSSLLASPGKLFAEAFHPLTMCLTILGPTRLTASSLRQTMGRCLAAASHTEWRVRLATTGTLRVIAERLPIHHVDAQNRDAMNGGNDNSPSSTVAGIIKQHRRKTVQILTDLKFDRISSVRKAAKEALRAWESVPAGEDEPTLLSVAGKENSGPKATSPPQRRRGGDRAASRPVWRPVALVPQVVSPRQHRAKKEEGGGRMEGPSGGGVKRREGGFRRPNRLLTNEQRDFGIVILEGPREPPRSRTGEVTSTAAPNAVVPSKDNNSQAIALGADLHEYSPPVKMPEGGYHHGKGSFPRREADAGSTLAGGAGVPPAMSAPPAVEPPTGRRQTTIPDHTPALVASDGRSAGLHSESIALQRVCAWVDGVSVAAGQTLGLGIQITAPPSPSSDPTAGGARKGEYPLLEPPPSQSQFKDQQVLLPRDVSVSGSPGVRVSVNTAGAPDDDHEYRHDYATDQLRSPSRRQKWSPPDSRQPTVTPHAFSFSQQPSMFSNDRRNDSKGIRESSVPVRLSERGVQCRDVDAVAGSADGAVEEATNPNQTIELSRVTDEEARLMGVWGFNQEVVATSSHAAAEGAKDSFDEVWDWFDERSLTSVSTAPLPDRWNHQANSVEQPASLRSSHEENARHPNKLAKSSAENVTATMKNAEDARHDGFEPLVQATAHERLDANGIDDGAKWGNAIMRSASSSRIGKEEDWRALAASSPSSRRNDAEELLATEEAARKSFMEAAEDAERAAAAVVPAAVVESTSAMQGTSGGLAEPLSFARAIEAADRAFRTFRKDGLDDLEAENEQSIASSPTNSPRVLSFADAVAAADKAYITMHRRYSPTAQPSSPMSPIADAAPASSSPTTAVPGGGSRPPTAPPIGREVPSTAAAVDEAVEQAVRAGLSQHKTTHQEEQTQLEFSPASLSLTDAANRRQTVGTTAAGGSSLLSPASLKDGLGDDAGDDDSRPGTLLDLLGITAAEQTPDSVGATTPVGQQAVKSPDRSRPTVGSPAMAVASGGPLEPSEARGYRMRRHMADAIVDISRLRVPETTPERPSRSASPRVDFTISPPSPTVSAVAPPQQSRPRPNVTSPRSRHDDVVSDRCDALMAEAAVTPPLEGRSLERALQRILQLQTEAFKAQYRAAHREQLNSIRSNNALTAVQVAEQEALILRATETALQSEIQEFIDELLPKLASKLVGDPPGRWS